MGGSPSKGFASIGVDMAKLASFPENAAIERSGLPAQRLSEQGFMNANQNVDPFNPGPNRYPTATHTGFDVNELNHALMTYRMIAATPPHADKFFNIRGIQSSTGSTVGSIGWDRLRGHSSRMRPPSPADRVAPGTTPCRRGRRVS